MPFIEAAIEEAREQEAVPEGAYDLRCVACEVRDSKSGKPMAEILIAVESSEFPNAAPINHYLSFPDKDDEDSVKDFKTLQIARFLKAFDVPHEGNGFDTDDIVGCTAEGVLLIQDEYQKKDEHGNNQGHPIIKNLMQLPKLVSEPEEKPSRKSTKPDNKKGSR